MDIFTDKLSGIQFCMKIGNDCANWILENGIYEYSLIKWCEQYVTSEGNFVDIGAHMGTYSIILGKKCKEVYAFEAQKSTFDCLSIGVCINNAFNIKTHNVALGDKEGSLNLYQVSEDGGCSSLRSEVSKNMGYPVIDEEIVSVKTLDSFELKNVDFLKIDVEGYELNVLKGSVRTLVDNNFPPFVFEAWPDEWYKNDKELLISFVKNLGYEVYPIAGYGNMYLASDHPLRSKKDNPSPEPKIEKYNVKILADKYDKNILDPEWGAALNTDYTDDLYDESENDHMIEAKEEFIMPWDAWHALSKHFRLTSRHEDSYKCAHNGLKSKHPLNKEHLLYEELSIVCYYLDNNGRKKEALDACEKVLLAPETAWNVRNQTVSNVGFYTTGINIKRKISLSHSMQHNYTPSSASLIKHEDGYRANLRGVNYYLNKEGYGVSRHGDNIIRTLNYLLHLDKDFNITKSVEMKDESGTKIYPKNVIGMEDIRLFGDKYFLCTYPQLNETKNYRIGWGTYDETGKVTRMIPLMANNETKCEKNWLPFIDNNKIYIIYSVGPLQIYKLNQEDGSMKEVSNKSLFSDKYINDFRGSSSPIKYKDGWLATIHQVYYAQPRKYFHRLIWFDKDFNDMKYSGLFFFDKPGIEFNLSICHSDEGLLMTYSHFDASSSIAVVDYSIIDEMLKL